jgi:sulfite reductase (NADPH) hemoprotein beta-component
MIGQEDRDFLPEEDLLAYLEAILRVYNRYGRRDNKYKARIKILVHETGIDEADPRQVEAEFARIRDGALALPEAEVARIDAYFAPPPCRAAPAVSKLLAARRAADPAFAAGSAATCIRTSRPAMPSSPSR